MNYFFVDFENVHTEELSSMSLVQEGDTVFILYSENSKSITLDVVDGFTRKGAALKCFKAAVGTKNALDFQLASYLGYIIGQRGEGRARYYIVSKDTGFQKLCEFWCAMGADVRQIGDLAGGSIAAGQAQPPKPKEKKQPQTGITPEELAQYLPPEEDSAQILEIINRYKTKQAIMNGISKIYKDSQRAGAIYKRIKPLLTEKGKT